MLRLLTGLTAALLMASPALAGELDAEFNGKKAPSPTGSNQKIPPSNNATKAIEQQSAVRATASELDDESPMQAHRWGWGGWRGGWGGGYRWGAHYRPWGYYGWRRPWYWGGPYVSLGLGYPYYGYPYYSLYDYASIAYPSGVWYSSYYY